MTLILMQMKLIMSIEKSVEDKEFILKLMVVSMQIIKSK